MKLTITQIGTPKETQTQYGLRKKNYIKAQEYGDKYLNYYCSPTNQDWKVGQIVEVENVAEREYTNKEGKPAKAYDIKFPRMGGGAISPAQQQFQTNLTIAVTNLDLKVSKIGKMLEKHFGVIATKDAIIPKSLDEIANEEFDAVTYPENNLGEIDFDPEN